LPISVDAAHGGQNAQAAADETLVEDASATILLIDDEEPIRKLLARLLAQDGYRPIEAADAESAMEAVVRDDVDLVLLDVMMPAVDGIDLLRRVRAASDVPVIMLTGLGSEADRVLGLRTGADDYVVKPFSPAELTARIESVLRRARLVEPLGNTTLFGTIEIDTASREVYVRGVPADLTPKEFDLLAFLVGSPRQVFTRGQLLDQVWSSSADWQDPSTVTEHVRRLRLKIEDDPERPRLLVTVRGVGYRYEPAQEGGAAGEDRETRGRRSTSR
jgi:DNA-binding response OmpR family regulator